jgi:Kef-type K+ transport system membrane component KefB
MTTLLVVVGLDDALSLLLYSLVAAFAASLMVGGEAPNLIEILELPFIEIGGSIVLGFIMGYALNWLMHRMKSRHDAMAVSIGFVLLAAGISLVMDVSPILTTVVLGMVTVNCCPEHGRHIRYTIEQAGPVIYVLFFTLVGARFQISLLPTMGFIGLAYIILRSTGKFGGAWLGGKIGGAEPAVRNNLGFGLLSQAGVAIGLALASAARFSQYGEEGQALSNFIINVITATTFVVQIIGPIAVKFATCVPVRLAKHVETRMMSGLQREPFSETNANLGGAWNAVRFLLQRGLPEISGSVHPLHRRFFPPNWR